MVLTGDALIEIPPELIESFGGLVTILKALGWMVIFYIAFNIINALINKGKKRQLEQINNNLKEIKKILRKNNKKF